MSKKTEQDYQVKQLTHRIDILHNQVEDNRKRIIHLECPRHVWKFSHKYRQWIVTKHETYIIFTCIHCGQPETHLLYELKGPQKEIAEAMELVEKRQ